MKSLNQFYYSRGYPGSACKVCQNMRTASKARLVKNKAVVYKGGICEDCKQTFHSCVYDFHHQDPQEKDFKISSSKVKAMSWTLLKRELDKCALLCSNCHRLRHYNYV